MKNLFNAETAAKFKAKIYKLKENDILICIVMGVLTNLILEVFNRMSFISALSYCFTDPLGFIFNTSILTLTYSLATFMKRRLFGYVTVAVLWLTLGIINFFVLLYRTTPISSIDLQLAGFFIPMMTKYLSGFFIAVTIVCAVGIVVGICFLFKKCKRKTVALKKSVLTVAAFAIFVSVGSVFAAGADAYDGVNDSLEEAYDRYGFVYSFTSSVFDIGIDRPGSYSDKQIASVIAEIEEKYESSGIFQAAEPGKSPNIVVLQLESFLSPRRISGLELSESATPNFDRLFDSSRHGKLTVPARGGATANVEFEFLAGMSLDYFGLGEYPYQTVLRHKQCPGIAHTLSPRGYVSHGIHNHEGSFYNRINAYEMLGFDSFTGSENMSDLSYNYLGWERDAVLADEVLGALNSTEGTDFVFTVSVQAHGRYPEAKPEGIEYAVTVTENLTENSDAELEYYVNQLYESDKMLGDLVERLSALEEETVLVVYGDHQPALIFDENELDGLDLYQTEYFIWSNKNETEGNRDLSTYQLSSLLFDYTDAAPGIVDKLHRLYLNELIDGEKYSEYMEILQYDALYGDRYCISDGYFTERENEYVLGWRNMKY